MRNATLEAIAKVLRGDGCDVLADALQAGDPDVIAAVDEINRAVRCILDAPAKNRGD